MGLFSSREDKIKKLDEKISSFDDELIYKRALSALKFNAEDATDVRSAEAYILHHDLQEIKEELKKMNQKQPPVMTTTQLILGFQYIHHLQQALRAYHFSNVQYLVL